MCFFPFHKEDYFFWAVFSVNVWSAALKFHRTFKVPTAEKVFCTLLLQLDVWPWRCRMMYEQSLMIEGCFFFFTSICWRGRGESFSLLTWTSEFNMFYLRVEFRTWQLVFFQWVRWGNLRLPVQVGFFNRVVESGEFNRITLLPVWNLWFRIFCTFQNKLPATLVVQENAATLFCREAPATSVQRWEGDDWIFHCWMNLSINLFFAAVNSKRLFYKHLPRSSAPGKVACGF